MGVYKRNSKLLSFFIGFSIAVLANADTFYMTNNLMKADNDFINQVATTLESTPNFFTCDRKNSDECFTQAKQDQLKKIITDTGSLPLGWNYDEKLSSEKTLFENKKDEEKKIAKIKEDYEMIKLLEEGETNIASCKVDKNIIDDKNNEDKGKKCFDALEKQLFLQENNSKISHLDESFKSSFKEADKERKKEKLSNLRNKYTEIIEDIKSDLKVNILSLKDNQIPKPAAETPKDPLYWEKLIIQ